MIFVKCVLTQVEVKKFITYDINHTQLVTCKQMTYGIDTEPIAKMRFENKITSYKLCYSNMFL